jgi:hypothetical protein
MLISIRLVIATLFLSLSQTNFAAVGKVTEQTGPTEIVRNKTSISAKVGSGVEMNDTIVTAKAKAKLTFEDNTTVNITEQSKLVVDDFVYDPKKGSGKLAMKVVMGTARYASGQIAKTNPQQVAINTPTATVAVRGTDFSMTVDELGRSLIMLLPSCDEKKKACVTGAITVKNDAGEVFMNEPYQTTVVASLNTPPTAPVIISIDQANIDNLLIVSPPKEIKEVEVRESKTLLDKNFLNVDLLAFKDLDENKLENFKELDINLLDINFLFNMLDAEADTLSKDSLSAESRLLPDFKASVGAYYFFNDDQTMINVCKFSASSTACVRASVTEDKTVVYTQQGATYMQNINKGGSTTITLIQK